MLSFLVDVLKLSALICGPYLGFRARGLQLLWLEISEYALMQKGPRTPGFAAQEKLIEIVYAVKGGMLSSQKVGKLAYITLSHRRCISSVSKQVTSKVERSRNLISRHLSCLGSLESK